MSKKSPFEGGSEHQRAGGCSPANHPLPPSFKTMCKTPSQKHDPSRNFIMVQNSQKQIHGIQFFRKKPVEKFILDFYAKSIKLAIEVDGGQHFTTEHEIKDMNRDACLANLGIYTLRFTNLEVLRNCEGVLRRIEVMVRKLTSPCSQR